MTVMPSAYDILGVGVITIEDLDTCGLGKTADAIIKKTFFGLLDLHSVVNVGAEVSKAKSAEIKNAYSLIGFYDDRQEYNIIMRTNGFIFSVKKMLPATKSEKHSTEKNKDKGYRQVSFNENDYIINTTDCDLWEKYQSVTSPNSDESPNSYDDINQDSDNELNDQKCQECDQNCSMESMGCYWFIKQPLESPDKDRKCDDCKITNFMMKMNISAMLKPYIKIARFSKTKLENIVTECQDPKNAAGGNSKEEIEMREMFWNDKKEQIMIEIASFVHHCYDDKEGMDKLTALIECAANL